MVPLVLGTQREEELGNFDIGESWVVEHCSRVDDCVDLVEEDLVAGCCNLVRH